MVLRKGIAIVCSVAVVCGLIVCAALIRAFHTFSVEDKIHDTFFPVATALYDYQHDHGSPATNLTQLVPAYVPQIPSSPLVDSVAYSVIKDGKEWQLSLHSRALSKPRIYCCRSTQNFTQEEEHRVVLRYHGVWTVLTE